MIATIATTVAIAAIVAIDGFHMIAAIAEKVNEDRGYLRLTTSFAPFVNCKFNMAGANRQLLLEAWFFLLMGVFQRGRRRERQRIPLLNFFFQRSQRSYMETRL